MDEDDINSQAQVSNKYAGPRWLKKQNGQDTKGKSRYMEM